MISGTHPFRKKWTGARSKQTVVRLECSIPLSGKAPLEDQHFMKILAKIQIKPSYCINSNYSCKKKERILVKYEICTKMFTVYPSGACNHGGRTYEDLFAKIGQVIACSLNHVPGMASCNPRFFDSISGIFF